MSRQRRARAALRSRAEEVAPSEQKPRSSHSILAERTDSIPVSKTFSLLLFISGIAALIYQLLWIKQLSLIVGIEVYAVTTAVSAFFVGLASGAAIFGRVADHTDRPLRLYGQLEIGVAFLSVAVTLVLPFLAAPFAALENKLFIGAWLLLYLIVALPAFLMGGTLPVLVRAQALQTGSVSRKGGILYAANTAGAVLGALITPFVQLPSLGVRGAALAAAFCNIVVALVAFRKDRATDEANIADVPIAAAEHEPMDRSARIAILLYSLAGGIALGYEVLWSQIIIQFMSTRSFAFAIVLATFLAGIVIGSFLYSRFADRIRDPWAVFGILIAAAGFLALLSVAGIGRWFLLSQWYSGQAALSVTSSEFTRVCARFLVASVTVVFGPAVLLGAAFPAALRLTVNPDRVGRDVGLVFALNTAGGILGTLATGFLLIPKLGLVRSLETLTIAATIIGLIAVFRGANFRRSYRWIAVCLLFATIAVTIVTPRQKLAMLTPRMHGSPGEVIFYEEDPGGTVIVVQERAGERRFRRLYIQGVSNSGDSLPSVRYMRLQALVPLLIHKGDPKEALVIGLGTGITAGATLAYSGLNTRVVDELMPGVVHATPLFRANLDAASDPKIQLRLRDGRRDLLQSSQQYDIVTLEPPPPAAAGVVNLYSTSFYKLVRARLKTDGLLAQWLPLPTQNAEDTRSLIRSFLDVFPYASLWTTELHEMMLIGSASPIELDYAQISTRMARPELALTLREVGINSPQALLATWVTDSGGLGRYAGNAPPVTDDRPRIEYAGWVRRNEITRVLPKLIDLQSPPPLQNADQDTLASINSERETLHAFYAAGLAAYASDRASWVRLMAQVAERDPRNPYYRWLAGEQSQPAEASDSNR
jgi:spermidine synthase